MEFERDLQIARQIQASFLPDALPQVPGWDLAARSHPARLVGGDFYDAFPLVNNRRLGFVIADVSDKGVGAALFMALFRSLLRAFAQQHHALRWMDDLAHEGPSTPVPGTPRSPLLPLGASAMKNAVVLTNNYIATTHARAYMFATLFFGLLDPATGALAYVNAGHDPPLLLRPTGVAVELGRTGPLVGLMPDLQFNVAQAHIEPGEILLAYTDGVTEARAPDGSFFTKERLHALVAEPAPSAAALLDLVEARVGSHIGSAEPSDDLTMLAIRREIHLQSA
jgi:sigma-B regulation protein RsbU (phosphoserine phosphatase)